MAHKLLRRFAHSQGQALPLDYTFVGPPPRHLLPRGVQEKLVEFPVSVTIPIAWGQQDLFGHLNNVHYFRFMEDARMQFLSESSKHLTPQEYEDLVQAKAIGVIMATSSIVYKTPVVYPDTLTMGVRISEWKEDRFNFSFRSVSHQLNRIATEGDGWTVTYDYRIGKKALIPPRLKQAFEKVNNGIHKLD